MFLVGLTGGIASGKSTVSAMLGKFDVEIIDADLVAREVVEPGTVGLRLLVDAFGEQVLDSDGKLSRSRLADIVFAKPEKREILESILHPLIKERTLERLAQSDQEIVVYMVPLLVEAAVDYPFDFVVTVEAGAELQIRRLMETRGLSREEAVLRLKAQASEAERVARADVRLDSSIALSQLERSVSQLWAEIEQMASKKASHGTN